MNIEFRVEQRFEKELEKYNKSEKKKIIEKINFFADCAENDNLELAYHHLHKLKIPEIENFIDTTLYSYKIDKKLRLIILFDEDPLFDQIIVTLLRIVSPDDYNKVFKSIAESLYQKRNGGF